MTLVRTTLVVPDRTALIHARTEHALAGTQGTQVMTLPHLVSRLAGGFLRPATTRDVEPLIAQDLPLNAIPSLAAIADLPGFGRAVARTLDLAWRAGFDLDAIHSACPDQPRWSELVHLEQHVSRQLSTSVLPAPRLARRAMDGVRHAPNTLGTVQLQGLDDVEPVYRPVLEALADHVDVHWICSIDDPVWAPERIHVHPPEPTVPPPDASIESHPTPYQEVRNALRWLRGKLEAGIAPGDIAIVASIPEPYEASLVALLGASTLPVHAVQGVRILHQPLGQTLAALADAVTFGPSRAHVERIVHAGHAAAQPALMAIPRDWSRTVAPTQTWPTLDAWPIQAPDDVTDDVWERLTTLRDDIVTASTNPASLAEGWLDPDAATTWRDLASRGPISNLTERVASHRSQDEADPTTSVLWGPIDTLLGTPRRHVRVLGMTSSAWPRRHHEDPLLPERVLDGRRLEQRTPARIDRSTFHAITRTAVGSLTISFPRMGSDGRTQRPSPLLAPFGDVRVVTSDAVSDTPIDERDRRRQRPGERHAEPFVQRAVQAFENRRTTTLTAHDGILDVDDRVREALAHVLDAPLSATTIEPLINDPFHFLAASVLRWSEPPLDEQPLQLDPLTFGSLCHLAIERSHRHHGLTTHLDAIRDVVTDVCDAWAAEHPTPPAALWRGYQERIVRFVARALGRDHGFRVHHSHPEVTFGDARFGNPDDLDGVWDGTKAIHLGRSTLRGTIDRLDLDAEDTRVRVIDYKTGRSKSATILDREREVQRTVYVVAVKEQLGGEVAVEAMLHYLADDRTVAIPASDVGASIARLEHTLDAARTRITKGHAIPAASVPRHRSAFALALPANLAPYLDRKRPALAAIHAPVDIAWTEGHA